MGLAVTLMYMAYMAYMACIACEKVESTDIKTSGMYADFKVEADSDAKSDVIVALKVGGGASNTFIELQGGDKVTAVTDGITQDVSRKTSVLNSISYRTSFEGAAANKAFTVSFTRPDGDNAPSSTVSLPAPFASTAPLAAASLSRATDAIAVTWSPSRSSDSVRIEFNGPCIFLNAETTTDSGTFSLAPASLRAPEKDINSTCDLSVTVERTGDGAVDPAFREGGRFRATQRRSVTLTTTP